MVDQIAEDKFGILRRVFELAREQRDALEQDQLDRFQRILDERERLIGELRQLVEQHGAVPENVIAFPGADDDTLALDAMLKGILEFDRHNEALLARKMDEIQSELPQLAEGQRAAAGYRVVRDAASYVDRRS
jgi:hypothetical protein